jgi:hypothetical protein
MNYSQIQIWRIARRSLIHLCIVVIGLSGFVLSGPVAADDQLACMTEMLGLGLRCDCE